MTSPSPVRSPIMSNPSLDLQDRPIDSDPENYHATISVENRHGDVQRRLSRRQLLYVHLTWMIMCSHTGLCAVMFSSLKVLELLFLMQHSILVSVRGSATFLIGKRLTKVNSVRNV